MTFIGFGEDITTTADTTPVTKRPDPTKAPTEKNIPPPSLPAADIEARTSGAPFPKARSVTPANDSENFNVSATFSKAGDKYPSAVDPNMLKAQNNHD